MLSLQCKGTDFCLQMQMNGENPLHHSLFPFWPHCRLLMALSDDHFPAMKNVNVLRQIVQILFAVDGRYVLAAQVVDFAGRKSLICRCVSYAGR